MQKHMVVTEYRKITKRCRHCDEEFTVTIPYGHIGPSLTGPLEFEPNYCIGNDCTDTTFAFLGN